MKNKLPQDQLLVFPQTEVLVTSAPLRLPAACSQLSRVYIIHIHYVPSQRPQVESFRHYTTRYNVENRTDLMKFYLSVFYHLILSTESSDEYSFPVACQ